MEVVENGPPQIAVADAIKVGFIGCTPPVSELLPGRLQITLRSEATESIDQTPAPVDDRAKSVKNNGAQGTFRGANPVFRRQACHDLLYAWTPNGSRAPSRNLQ